MTMELYDVIRSLVTNAMIVALLFTLAQPKVQKRTLWIVFASIVALDFAMNAFFYLRADYTTLALIDMLLFIFIGAATKPLFKETLMSIVQHDRRHFNNTLLTLLQENEADKAIELIRKQSDVLPQKPRRYCENVPVNAAVSYYTLQA